MPVPAITRSIFAYVGCFTTPKRQGRGEGIEVYKVDPIKGRWTLIQQVGGLTNPAWLHLNRAETALYVGHGDTDYVSAFRIDASTGVLSPLGRANSGGENVVSCRLDSSQRFLITANFNSGKLGVLPVGEDGTPGPPTQIVTLPGEPRSHRRAGGQQESSHPHDVVFDPSGRFVIVPDEGLDRIHIFRFKAGRLEPADPCYVFSRSGSGPRHALFHPSRPFAWVVNVLDSTIVSYHWDSRRGRLQPFHVAMALPDDYAGDNRSNELAFDSLTQTLYVVNTPHDTFFRQHIDSQTGVPKPLGWERVRGKRVRFFAFHEATDTFAVAYQDSDSIAAFKADPRTGCLEPFGPSVHTPTPTCILLSGNALSSA